MSADYISILIMAMANGYDDGHGYANACCYDSDMYNNQIQGGGVGSSFASLGDRRRSLQGVRSGRKARLSWNGA